VADVRQDINAFSNGAEQADDITMMVLSFKERAAPDCAGEITAI
jgi:hypothetical protein